MRNWLFLHMRIRHDCLNSNLLTVGTVLYLWPAATRSGFLIVRQAGRPAVQTKLEQNFSSKGPFTIWKNNETVLEMLNKTWIRLILYILWIKKKRLLYFNRNFYMLVLVRVCLRLLNVCDVSKWFHNCSRSMIYLINFHQKLYDDKTILCHCKPAFFYFFFFHPYNNATIVYLYTMFLYEHYLPFF